MKYLSKHPVQEYMFNGTTKQEEDSFGNVKLIANL